MTSKDVAKSVSKFGGIFIIHDWLTAVACYSVGPLIVRLQLRARMIPLHILKTSTNADTYVDT